ncbi:tRNA (5-methylaminomethyl-2-thiouridine)(34)-methyltransferase MnmD [Roseibium sp.]|uniref:tRNA (5-methylaminomethyl-2-thiouridine)(34)-methyltransferase MnmD n=1 Tax=Roseibium sp. TaxID=1936156 RepID=UPI003A9819B0
MSRKQDEIIASATSSLQPSAGENAVSAPELEWLSDGVPRAPAFGDTYFSRAGGLAETRHVFLAGNGLPERWQAGDDFIIAELGFGTGLNFLTTLHAMQQMPQPPKLTFLSFELFPMTAEQLSRALGAFPELETQAEALLRAWSPEPGWNRWCVQDVDLVIGVGDARTLLADAGRQLPAGKGVDAWFLDGFSPSKNPELWGEELLVEVYRSTANGGTLATYTAAGWVRRNLSGAGFNIEKRKGFAGKREMVVGWKA